MSLSLAEIVTQALGFLILVFVMKRIFWKPLLASLEARREKIEESFDQIEDAKEEIETLRSDYHSRIEKIEEEARAKIQSAVEEGRGIAHEIQEKAREESKQLLTRTKEDLALEIEKARKELRREIADLTVRITEKFLREEMTEARHREKILALIDELEGAKP